MNYPAGLEDFKAEFEADGVILEVFDCPPVAQIVIIKDHSGKIYMQEFYYSNGWEMGSTRLHSLETGIHLLCHMIRYWQKEIANEMAV